MRYEHWIVLGVLATGVQAGAETPGTASAPTSAPVSAPTAAPAVITTAKGKVGDLLREWAAAGTAAGNVGDWYDNRDRGHSQLDISPYPQLQKLTYTKAESSANRDWALRPDVVGHITFGNSSTAAPAPAGGSNPRMAYAAPGGLAALYRQYAGNNLYMYPAHHDFHAGHNGLTPGGMYGDLFPANTPYVIISRGSSGTDQPFMRAVPFTLAAFRPEVKKKLAEEGMLMPAVQMIFRMSNAPMKEAKDYLTGKAHPPVFNGGDVNVEKMVAMAHGIDLGHLPPVVGLKLVETEAVKPGQDYVDPHPTEKIGETPGSIALAFRATKGSRRVVVSAEGSRDANGLPLTYEWVVLQGDAGKVRIEKKNKAGSVAEITFGYHERAPIAAGSDIESNRVDVGVFVNNGTYYSAPGFVTSFSFDCEARTYDPALPERLLEVGYGMGESALTVGDWGKFCDALITKRSDAGVKLLLAEMKVDAAAVEKMVLGYADAVLKADEAEKARKAAEEAQKKDAKNEALNTALKNARTAAQDAAKVRDEWQGKIKGAVMAPLVAMMNDVTFYRRHGEELGELPAAVRKAGLEELAGYGIIKAGAGFELLPLLVGKEAAEARLSKYQRALIARFNGRVLAAKLPGLKHEYKVNLTDFRLTFPKNWRDVYHYAADGTRVGYTRYDGKKAVEFCNDGGMVLTRDERGRVLTARTVRYEQATPAGVERRSAPDLTPFTVVPGTAVMHYEYDGAKDFVGRAVMTTLEQPTTREQGKPEATSSEGKR